MHGAAMTKKPKRRRVPAGFDESFELFVRRCGNPQCQCNNRSKVYGPWDHVDPCPLAPIFAEWRDAAHAKWARLIALSPAIPVDLSND